MDEKIIQFKKYLKHQEKQNQYALQCQLQQQCKLKQQNKTRDELRQKYEESKLEVERMNGRASSPSSKVKREDKFTTKSDSTITNEYYNRKVKQFQDRYQKIYKLLSSYSKYLYKRTFSNSVQMKDRSDHRSQSERHVDNASTHVPATHTQATIHISQCSEDKNPAAQGAGSRNSKAKVNLPPGQLSRTYRLRYEMNSGRQKEDKKAEESDRQPCQLTEPTVLGDQGKKEVPVIASIRKRLTNEFETPDKIGTER